MPEGLGATRVLLVGDQDVLHSVLQQVLPATDEIWVVGATRSSEVAVALAMRTRPELILLEPGTPASAHRIIRRLLGVSPRSAVVALTAGGSLRAVRDGTYPSVCGHLYRNVSPGELAEALRPSSAEVATFAVCPPGEPEASETALSRREREVLGLVARAMSNRQIADELCITEGTVKRHLHNIFGKLGAVSRIDAVNKASASPAAGTPQTHGRGRRSGVTPGSSPASSSRGLNWAPSQGARSTGVASSAVTAVSAS